MVTITGRWSSNKPIFRDVPRKPSPEFLRIKEAFGDDMELIEVDLSWAEQRVLDQMGEV